VQAPRSGRERPVGSGVCDTGSNAGQFRAIGSCTRPSAERQRRSAPAGHAAGLAGTLKLLDKSDELVGKGTFRESGIIVLAHGTPKESSQIRATDP